MKTGAMLKLGLVLAAFATGACVVLALVYTATADVIKRRADANLEATLKEIFPDADGFAEITGDIRSQQDTVNFGSEYAVRRGGELLGAAIQASGPSYGGLITVLVGVGIDGRINGVKILEHSDTPGLGANAAYPGYFVNKEAHITFYGQFAGKSVDDPFEVNQDVITVTAATITSRAVSGVIKTAGTSVLAWLAAQGDILSGGAAPSEGAAQ
ncbi:MAG: FMN-binding protein [Spirochaetaceae bacterium]|jgi:electron transport complex protein RnfG|nr:FMN-binding protein [Spirochaetaceae bacterium]